MCEVGEAEATLETRTALDKYAYVDVRRRTGHDIQ